MNQINRRRALAYVGAAVSSMALHVRAQSATDWPKRPIRWVVPYQAGTGPDNTARILAEAVSPLLGQPVVIDNKGGAAGNLGARLVTHAPADGYTWIYSAAPMAANMRIYKEPGFDALKDFRHIMRLTSSDILLVVNPNSGINALADLVAKAKANPGKLNYASGGVGTPSHLGVELLLSALDLDVTHVPYKGANELVQAVMSNQVTFGMPIFSVAYPHVRGGKLKALAVAGAARNQRLASTPTLAELNVKGVELTSWGGVSAPKGTPDAIVSKVRAAFERALAQPSVIAAVEKNGGQVSVSDEAAYVRGFNDEIKFTEAMMKKIGLQPT